jgi:plastocyanin
MTGSFFKTFAAAAALLGAASGGHADSISGKVTLTGLRSNANAVVYIEKIDGKTFPPPQEPVVMNQESKEFIPQVLPVVVGTTVNFLNSDPFIHNVLTPDGCADEFDLGSWPTGEVRSFTFNSPCAAALLCSVHPEMLAFVVAVDTPYYAVTDAEGSYTIPDLPAGTYTVSVWHERLKKVSETITVSGNVSVDFTLKR